MNWIFDIFNGGVKKNAELTNRETEFERKIEANDWIKETMETDEEALVKEAAYELGDTQEDTINKDYKLEISGLSDYNLAEMIAELKCSNDLLATLDFNEEKEKALKSVKSNRKSIETKLLGLIGEHTLVDWKEAFKKFEEVDVVHPKDKDLYEQMPSGKWRKKTKFAPLSDKEKVEQMEGVGKEEEKGALAKDASLKTASDAENPSDAEFGVGFESVPEIEESKPKLDDKITTKIDEKIEEKAEDIAVKIEEKIEEHADEMAEKVEQKIEQKIDEAFNAGPVVAEDSPEDKVLDKLEVPHLEPGETPKSEMKEWKEDKKEEPKKKDKKKDDKEEKEDDEKEEKDEKSSDKEASAQPELDKEAASNKAVIDAFISRSNPNAKSGNLYIRERQDGWDLVNYQTVIARHLGDKILLDNRQYSVTTSKLQGMIGAMASMAGIPVVDMQTGKAEEHKTPREKADYNKLPANTPYERVSSAAELTKKAYHSGDKAYYHGHPCVIKDISINPFSGEATAEIECKGETVHISGKELKNLGNEPLMEELQHKEAPVAPEVAPEVVAPEIDKKPEEVACMADEIQSKASKIEVIKKFALLSCRAEIDSPWKKVTNEAGEEIIARVAPTLREKKSKEKTKKVDIRSKENI